MLDLHGVEYTDCGNLDLLIHTFELVNEHGSWQRLCGVQPRRRAMLHTTRTDTILSLDGTREDSLAALRR